MRFSFSSPGVSEFGEPAAQESSMSEHSGRGGCSDPKAVLKSAILRELSDAERLLIILWYAERMTPEEIAQCLDLTPAQVEKHHEEIMARLRRRVAA